MTALKVFPAVMCIAFAVVCDEWPKLARWGFMLIGVIGVYFRGYVEGQESPNAK